MWHWKEFRVKSCSGNGFYTVSGATHLVCTCPDQANFCKHICAVLQMDQLCDWLDVWYELPGWASEGLLTKERREAYARIYPDALSPVPKTEKEAPEWLKKEGERTNQVLEKSLAKQGLSIIDLID